VYGCVGKNTPAGNAIRSIRTDDDLSAEIPVICFDQNAVFLRENLFYRNPLSNLQSSSLCFSCQPGIELIPADDSQSMPARNPDIQPLCFETKMNAIGIHVRDFTHIQTQTLEDILGVDDESACTKLGARVARFFQDQDSGREMWEVTREMKRRGEPTGPSTDDENIVFVHHLYRGILHTYYLTQVATAA